MSRLGRASAIAAHQELAPSPQGPDNQLRRPVDGGPDPIEGLKRADGVGERLFSAFFAGEPPLWGNAAFSVAGGLRPAETAPMGAVD
jgi:hypothetical protein